MTRQHLENIISITGAELVQATTDYILASNDAMIEKIGERIKSLKATMLEAQMQLLDVIAQETEAEETSIIEAIIESNEAIIYRALESIGFSKYALQATVIDGIECTAEFAGVVFQFYFTHEQYDDEWVKRIISVDYERVNIQSMQCNDGIAYNWIAKLSVQLVDGKATDERIEELADLFGKIRREGGA